MSQFPKLAFTVLFGALAAVALTGCIKTKSVVDLKADGSGVLTLSVTVDQSKSDELKQMMEGMGMGGQAGGGDFEEQLDFEKTAKAINELEGVRLVSQKSLDDAEKKIKGTEMVIAFDNLEALTKSGLIANLSTELKKNEDGTFTLTMSTVPEQLEGVDMTDPMIQQQMEGAKAMLPMFEPYLGGFEMSEIVKLPGEVTETNGTKAETGGNSVMWKMGFADTMDMKKLTRTVTFKGDGLGWSPFKVDAKTGRQAISAARQKVGDSGAASGPSALPDSPAELEAMIAAVKAKIAAHEAAVASATRARDEARKAVEAADKTLIEQELARDRAKDELEKLTKKLESMKEPAGTDGN